jgi:hypothetical protein
MLLGHYSIWLLSIGIEADAAGIGIPAFIISVQYRRTPVQDWVSLFWYRTGSGIGTSFHSGTELTRCRIVRDPAF